MKKPLGPHLVSPSVVPRSYFGLGVGVGKLNLDGSCYCMDLGVRGEQFLEFLSTECIVTGLGVLEHSWLKPLSWMTARLTWNGASLYPTWDTPGRYREGPLSKTDETSGNKWDSG